MGFRITDQPSDQHTQNPPPENDFALGEGQTKTVATVTADAPMPVPLVLRGAQGSTGLCLLRETDIPSAGPATPPITSTKDSLAGVTQVAAFGWVRRDTGATERIGAVEDHILRKLPPRWRIALVGVTDQVDGGNNKVAP